MSIHLYKHNEDAYRAVETMLEEKQMAAVIHPTGTGKSMIAFKLVEQHPHKHFLWLSPSEYIYKTQLENIDTQFSNIEYMSYSRLMKHEDSIDTLHPDYIILDEFHRCGAAEWGKSVRKLLEAYPKAKRLLYCIDMLNEGIHVDDVDGVILLRPTVSPIIYLQQIGRALSAGSKNQPVIFDLVNNFDSLYCIDCLKNEMQEAFLLYPDTHSPREHFDDRFRIIDETKDSREIFMRLQENLGNAWDTYYEAAKQWYEENGNLKIPKSYVTGAGLTLGAWINTQRRVKSGNISGNLTWEKIQKLNDIGMIWDVTDSSWQEVLEELKSYRNTYGNLDIKAKYVSPTGFRLGSWINNMRFKVKKYGIEQALTDEQRKELEELGMIWDHNKQKWEEYYSAAKVYYKEHGNLEVPAKYVTADGIPLGRWLSNQTNSSSMTDEQLKRLQSIGYRSESKTAIQWNRKFELAKKYYEENGNLDVPVSYSTDGVKLGRWISNIRCKRKNPKASGMVLDTERIARLDSIGMNWK